MINYIKTFKELIKTAKMQHTQYMLFGSRGTHNLGIKKLKQSLAKAKGMKDETMEGNFSPRG